MSSRIQTVVCPVCHKSRDVQGNTRANYEKRMCKACQAKWPSEHKKTTFAAPTTQAPKSAIQQAPCLEGQAHWWIVANGPGSEYCNNGCGQKMAPERWDWEPHMPRGVLEPHAMAPAWGLKPTMDVNYWG